MAVYLENQSYVQKVYLHSSTHISRAPFRSQTEFTAQLTFLERPSGHRLSLHSSTYISRAPYSHTECLQTSTHTSRATFTERLRMSSNIDSYF